MLSLPQFVATPRSGEKATLDILPSNRASENSIPSISCQLGSGGGSSPLRSSFLQFDYTSPNYPLSLKEDSSGLCTIRIDHNWKFLPRNPNNTDSSISNDSSSTSSAANGSETNNGYLEGGIDDEQFYQELCGGHIGGGTSTSGGSGGGGAGSTGTEGDGTGIPGGGGETGGNKPSIRTKPKICQVRCFE